MVEIHLKDRTYFSEFFYFSVPWMYNSLFSFNSLAPSSRFFHLIYCPNHLCDLRRRGHLHFLSYITRSRSQYNINFYYTCNIKKIKTSFLLWSWWCSNIVTFQSSHLPKKYWSWRVSLYAQKSLVKSIKFPWV